MGDWTTVKLSDDIEIDLHYDLDSFPAIIRFGDNHVVLSKNEIGELYKTLNLFFGFSEEQWRKYLLKLNEGT